MMKGKYLLFAVIGTLLFSRVNAQNSVGIGTENSNENAVLEFVLPTDNQEFLVPRLSSVQRLDMANGESPSVDINDSILLNEVLWVGVIVRNFNTYGTNAQINVAERFRFGYSFELPSNALITSSFGTHEFMVGIDLAIFDRQGGNYRYF